MKAGLEQRVLVLTPIGRDGAISQDLLEKAGIDAQQCLTLESLVTEVQRGAGAVFVAEEALKGPALAELEDEIALQEPWSDLPFVVLSTNRSEKIVASWRTDIVRTLRNVSLLERPVQAITLVSAVRTALRARQRQYEVRAHLERRKRSASELEQLVAERTQALKESNTALQVQITERAEIEERLRHAQKIEAIGQMTGGIAHDFNNLLMVITAGLDMLEKRPARGPEVIDAMKKAAARGARLTHQLLAFSRRQALKPQPIDLCRYLEEMSELLDRSLRGDVHVEIHCPDDLWPVTADPSELQLVILNLAVNARDAMPQGGTIVILAENAAGGITADAAQDYVRLSVIDSGTGMTPEVRARAFDPFFTTKDVGKGSGLGLAQVHGFVTQTGGSVEITSEVGQGTTITLLLPRSAVQPEQQDSRRASLPLATPHHGRVLLVEDEDEVAALVADMFNELGYEVTRASSAHAALGALANDRVVDLVFSDVMMPGGMNGLELSREIHRRRPGLPVLLTSGYAEMVKKDAAAEGVQLLPKPYQIEDLAAAIDVLTKSAGHAQAVQRSASAHR